jgi:stage IV sporulation protein A
MTDTRIYKDISDRTGGNVYVGVVGPVRTGKSTFIKRFMEALVLPNIDDEYKRDRARDELPQSASGKTVMTTEPKFIPEEAVEINIFGSGKLNVRMIDCVGYLIPEAMGTLEEGQPRLVRTPWREDPIPFSVAAEEGTKKVICDHSTIGVVVTSDGSIGEISRKGYEEAEERIVTELRAIGRPFVIVLNSSTPGSPEATSLGNELESKYRVPVALVNCLELDGEDIGHILEMVLSEFPIAQLEFSVPEWVWSLPLGHRLITEINEMVRSAASKVTKISDVAEQLADFQSNEIVDTVTIDEINMGNGCVKLTINVKKNLLYATWGRKTGCPLLDELGMTSEEMTVHLAKAYQKAANLLGAEISPVGACFCKLNKCAPEVELYNKDLSHPSLLGSTVAAITHYRCIFGELPKICKSLGLDSALESVLLQAAESGFLK